jgi:hypothetical protein
MDRFSRLSINTIFVRTGQLLCENDINVHNIAYTMCVAQDKAGIIGPPEVGKAQDRKP